MASSWASSTVSWVVARLTRVRVGHASTYPPADDLGPSVSCDASWLLAVKGFVLNSARCKIPHTGVVRHRLLRTIFPWSIGHS